MVGQIFILLLMLQKYILIDRAKEIRSFTYQALNSPLSEDELKNQKGLGKLSMSLKIE